MSPPEDPADNTTSQKTKNNNNDPIPMSPVKTDQANASKHAKSYQGTWVEKWGLVAK